MPNRRLRATEPPLYDPAFEHDACGVGFVADSTGTQRSRVLPLALAGLAALGHRGAFAADGESSDGAGVLLPLSPGVLERIGAPRRRGDRPGSLGVLTLFLPPGPRAPRGRRLVADVLAAEGLALRGWRGVPVDPAALGPEARSARPEIAHAFVDRPSGLRAGEFGRALVLARRRIEAAARSARLPGLAVASASAETIVYKALVRGDRLADFYPELAGSLDIRFAVFHQRYATNTHPVWRLAQPFGRIAHNGEINTVRANREELRGRSADLGRSELARRLTALGPLTSPDGSDSLSLDEALELLVASGWRLDTALAAIVPEAPALGSGTLDRPGAGGPLAPWDGPAALVFADGRRVGALLDRNGLRPAAFSVTSDGLVALASEAGAVPLAAAETVRRGRLGPGELLLVDLARRQVLENAEAKRAVAAASPRTVAPLPHSGTIHDRFHVATDPPKTAAPIRYLAGLDAERFRLDIRTMVLEGHEPLWSMGDDTPTAASARVDRRVADHLRQSFAQVTNPPIDPERERVVMDLSVELGRRPPLLGRRTAAPATLRLARPIVADVPGVLDAFEATGRPTVILDATWPAEEGTAGLERALDRLGRGALAAPSAHLVVLSDRRFALDRLPVPSVLAAGAVNTALTAGGRRGRTDILVEAADVLDPHALAMTLAAGARAVSPWLALELARELAGTRGAEELGPEDAAARLVGAFETALRKTLARMGISCLASYVGGQLFEVVELDPSVLRRCFPSAPSWPGRVRFADLAARQLRRLAAARELGHPLEPQRMPDPGLVRFRADGETHLYAPSIVREIQVLAAGPWDDAAASAPIEVHAALERYRSAIGRAPAVVRDQLVLRPSRPPLPLEDVEPVQAIAPRFVASAMSLGALSPEAHQAVTLGMQLFGGAANTGEGGEDPSWYQPGPDGVRRDAMIKQVASGRFGVTSAYLARADQLEIKIAQGSKPGEGGQLPGRKATAYIAALRRGRPGQSYISPPPHHDIYSIEDLAQLVADLRAIAPRARIGVKLVASRGIGTIAAGVAKAGADYVHVSGHAGGTGASPLSSIKHAGVPWELGLAEVHQVLLRNGLRDRIAVRVDGGLHTGRDLLVAALFGAEEFGFGTAALVAIGCDMARQCHLDTCPTGIATQREDLRAKFAGTPEDIVRFFTAIAEDLRHELALVGARSVGEVVGRAAELLAPARGSTLRLDEILCCGEWTPEAWRRDEPAAAGLVVRGAAASGLEETIVTAAVAGAGVVAGGRVVAGAGVVPGPRVVPGAPVEGGPRVVAGAPVEGGAGAAAGGGVGGVAGVAAGDLTLTTADRSFGARLSGALARGELHGPVRLGLRGAAGQSLGAFLAPGIELVFTGVANDYVAKGLSGGTLVVRPEHDFGADPAGQAIAGNTCLYGATAGRLHLIGRAGMRFAVRNSGADAVVEGIGPHGCEYMTGGIVVVLGPTGPNFGAGMTGGRAYLWCPEGSAPNGLATGLRSIHLSALVGDRPDAPERVAELRALVAAHAAAGSSRAAGLLADPQPIESRFWLIEPVDLPSAHEPIAVGAERPAPRPAHAGEGQRPVRTPASAQNPQPTRNRLVTGHPLNGRAGEP